MLYLEILLQEAEAQGENYDRLKLLEVTADDAEKLDKRKKRKKNADVGFSGMKLRCTSPDSPPPPLMMYSSFDVECDGSRRVNL
jgi:hypothetical protein